MRATAIVLVFTLYCYAAYDGPDTAHVIALDEMVVTASRTPLLPENAPQSVTVISKDEIAASLHDNVEDIVRSSAGIYNFRHANLHTNGIVGPLDIRGAGKNRVLFLVDGVPQNDNFNNSIAWVGWGHIPKDAIERIEIVRGPSSSLYGSEGLGGVINIITKKPNRGRQTGLRARVGNAATFGGDAYHIQRLGNFGLMAAGGYEQTDGFYMVEDPRDYEIRRRRTKGRVYGKLLYDFTEKSSLGVSALYFDQDANQGREFFRQELQLDQYTLNYSGYNDYARIGGMAFLNRADKTAYQDNAADNYTSLVRKERLKGTFNAGADFQGTLTNWDPVRITLGAAYKYINFNYDEDYPGSDRDAGAEGNQHVVSPFLHANVNVLNDRLLFLFGVRYDRIQTVNGGNWNTRAGAGKPAYDTRYGKTVTGSVSPKAGIAWRPDNKSTVRGSFGKGFRAPSLFELYKVHVRRGGTYYREANPDLGPERIYSWDIGGQRTFSDNIFAKLTFYQSLASDYIGNRLTGTATFGGGKTRKEYILDNISTVNIYGVETDLSWSPTEFLTFDGNYTFNISRIAEDKEDETLEGNYLPNNPRHSGHFGVVYRIPGIMDASLGLNAFATIFYDNENTLETDRYYTLDAAVSRRFFDMFTVFINAENILNNEYPIFLSTSGNTIAPGIIVKGGFKFEF